MTPAGTELSHQVPTGAGGYEVNTGRPNCLFVLEIVSVCWGFFVVV